MSQKILIIDDDVLCLDIADSYFQDKGFETTICLRPQCLLLDSDLKNCPQKTSCYDYVLTDNEMPGLNGIDFLELLERRGCKISKRRKAIISGSVNPVLIDRAEKIGVHVFQKPTPLRKLDEWVDGNY